MLFFHEAEFCSRFRSIFRSFMKKICRKNCFSTKNALRAFFASRFVFRCSHSLAFTRKTTRIIFLSFFLLRKKGEGFGRFFALRKNPFKRELENEMRFARSLAFARSFAFAFSLYYSHTLLTFVRFRLRFSRELFRAIFVSFHARCALRFFLFPLR